MIALIKASDWIGTLLLAARELQVTDSTKALLAGGLFIAAILLASVSLIYLPLALAGLTILYVIFYIVALRHIVQSYRVADRLPERFAHPDWRSFKDNGRN